MDFLEELQQLERSQSYRETKLKIELSEAVASAMAERGVSAAKLAELSKVSYQQILRILDDDHNSTIRTITKLAYALDYEPSLYFHPPGARSDLAPAGDIDFDLFLTDYPEHGVEIVHQANFENYDCLVAAGGDGTLFEVINGYYKNILRILHKCN